MLSYQHAYHAGGPADVHKHIVLARMLAFLTRDARPLTYMETHAGRGLYDLASAETAKTREADEGIALSDLSREPLGPVLDEVRGQFGATAYPGSPAIAAMMLREQDSMHLMELHPAEHAALADTLPGADIHRRDGYEGVLALCPPGPRAGLVLVDPSYEVKTEYAQVAEWVPHLRAVWTEAIILIWYPILRAARHEEMVAALAPFSPLRHEVRFHLKDGRGMTGSGILVFNAPQGFDPGPKRLP